MGDWVPKCKQEKRDKAAAAVAARAAAATKEKNDKYWAAKGCQDTAGWTNSPIWRKTCTDYATYLAPNAKKPWCADGKVNLGC